MEENKTKTGKVKKNLFKPGECPNPNGRPLGQRNYSTIYKEALIKLAESEGITPEDVENELIKGGLKHAKKDYRFYKDVLDRLHGQATQKHELDASINVTGVEINVRE